MVAVGSPTALVNAVPTTTRRDSSSALASFVESKTYRQVADLFVVQDTNRVLLLGRSRSYYVKQLATHAVLDFLPGVHVENAIEVQPA